MWAGGGGYIFWHYVSHNFGLVMRGGRGGGGGGYVSASVSLANTCALFTFQYLSIEFIK